MKEKLITFEIAKLAKEKGFNWPVNFYWYNNKPNDWHESDNDYLFNENEESDHISRPTQSLLQKWLREVKNCDVLTQINTIDMTGPKYYAHVSFDRNPLIHSDMTGYGDSYEAVFEVGLLLALQILNETK
jgi:hypothetical protein